MSHGQRGTYPQGEHGQRPVGTRQSPMTFSPARMEHNHGSVSGSLGADLHARLSEFAKHDQAGQIGQDSSYFGVNSFGGFLRETGQDFT